MKIYFKTSNYFFLQIFKSKIIFNIFKILSYHTLKIFKNISLYFIFKIIFFYEMI